MGEEETKQSDEKSFLEKTEALVKRNEEAVAKMEELTKRNEAIEHKRLIGGNTQAGQKTLTPEEQLNDEAKKRADEIAGAFKRSR